MAYVIAEPCIGAKDTACVDACPEIASTPRRTRPVAALSWSSTLGCRVHWV
jgi:Fe-S-cluster-containing dehydrogenase component